MNGHQGQGNDHEFKWKVKRILDDNPDTIGVRVERGGDDDWRDVKVTGEDITFADGETWHHHAHHAHDPTAHDDPPSVLLYDKWRLVVRDDMEEAFADFLAGRQQEPGAREPYVGLDGMGIIEIPHGNGDAYDVMTEFYDAHEDLTPDALPIGKYNPDLAQRALDPVSLNRHYLPMSHVFFWPESPRTPSSGAPLQAAAEVDDRVVVVIDTGINPHHVFLASGPRPADYLRSPADDGEMAGAGANAGHGTGVAAVVRQHNGGAKVLGARVALGSGRANTVEEAQIVATIDIVAKKFAADPRLVVLNLSFGGVVLKTSPLYRKLQDFNAGANRRVVAAAGNVSNVNDRRPMQPAAWPTTWAVASRDQSGQIHPWSNCDTPPFSVWVDDARNGEVDTADGTNNTDIVHWRGTSFAAPQVAAVI